MKKLLPIIFLLFGISAGIGLAMVLPSPENQPEQPIGEEEEMSTSSEYVKFNNQFVVPVVNDGRVQSMVVMSISLEVTKGSSARVYQAEPKLRDQILQELFNHANNGGFAGVFTSAKQMEILRTSLQHITASILGPDLRGVLITEIARQDGG